MIEAGALNRPGIFDDDERGRPAWRDDLRFFLRCYAWGFAFFLAFLS